MNRLITINAGGGMFQTAADTLTRFGSTRLSRLVNADASTRQPGRKAKPKGRVAEPVFVDVAPRVFEHILDYHRYGQLMVSPETEPTVFRTVMTQLRAWEIPVKAGSSMERSGGTGETTALQPVGPSALVAHRASGLPDYETVVVYIADMMQMDLGVKRHKISVVYGGEDFRLKNLNVKIRKDAKTLLSGSYWQIHGIHKRVSFLQCTKVPNTTADLLITSLVQHVVAHTEAFGYKLENSSITLSPDIQNTKVRTLYNYLVFRRCGEANMSAVLGTDVAVESTEAADDDDTDDSSAAFEEEADDAGERFAPPHVGPVRPMASPARPSVAQSVVSRIWEDK